MGIVKGPTGKRGKGSVGLIAEEMRTDNNMCHSKLKVVALSKRFDMIQKLLDITMKRLESC